MGWPPTFIVQNEQGWSGDLVPEKVSVKSWEKRKNKEMALGTTWVWSDVESQKHVTLPAPPKGWRNGM